MANPIDIRGIALSLNERADTHAIGDLQTIRAELKGLRKAGSKIFNSKTIFEEWAFHVGARSHSELQFNIGTERPSELTELRHGVAFSFEPSRTQPSLDGYNDKVHHFDDYISGHPEAFGDMRMWHYDKNDSRSNDFPPAPVMQELAAPGTFVFLGKRQPQNNIDYEVILNDFDRLLPLFVYVESNGKKEAAGAVVKEGFSFRAGFTAGPATTTATVAGRKSIVNLKHNELQAALYRQLKSSYGAPNVGGENWTIFGKIDIVVRRSDNEVWCYEIKTALEPRTCYPRGLRANYGICVLAGRMRGEAFDYMRQKTA